MSTGKARPAEVRSRTGGEIFFEKARIQGRRHDSEFQIGARRRLELEGAGQGDVAIEMALVEFIEKNRGNAAQLRILNELTQKNSLRDETDAGPDGTSRFRIGSDNPTSSPRRTLRSAATRAASNRVASRRGWRMTTWPSPRTP